jgi:hypothetical protein
MTNRRRCDILLLMDALDLLTKRVQQAAVELTSLKKEKRQLLGEVDRLRAEQERLLKSVRENETARRQQEKIRTRLEKISRKIDRHLMSDSSAAVALGEVS